MKSIITALIATAVLGAPVFTQDTPRAVDAPEAPQLPRTAQPMQAPQPAPPAQLARALQPAEAPEAAPVLARSPQPARAPQPPQPERQPAEERERTPAPPPPSGRRPVPTANVKVDVTITDQTGTATPMKKVVTMIVADGLPSGVRSMTSVPLATGGPNRELPLNVDTTVNITADRRVLLDLRFSYASVSFVTPVGARERPEPATDAERDMAAPRAATSTITENLTVLLTPGTPVVTSRSADAASDRTVTVEVKAEILK